MFLISSQQWKNIQVNELIQSQWARNLEEVQNFTKLQEVRSFGARSIHIGCNRLQLGLYNVFMIKKGYTKTFITYNLFE